MIGPKFRQEVVSANQRGVYIGSSSHRRVYKLKSVLGLHRAAFDRKYSRLCYCSLAILPLLHVGFLFTLDISTPQDIVFTDLTFDWITSVHFLCFLPIVCGLLLCGVGFFSFFNLFYNAWHWLTRDISPYHPHITTVTWPYSCFKLHSDAWLYKTLPSLNPIYLTNWILWFFLPGIVP